MKNLFEGIILSSREGDTNDGIDRTRGMGTIKDVSAGETEETQDNALASLESLPSLEDRGYTLEEKIGEGGMGVVYKASMFVDVSKNISHGSAKLPPASEDEVATIRALSQARRGLSESNTDRTQWDTVEVEPFERDVAIKVIRPEFLKHTDPAFLDRFKREYLVHGALTTGSRYLVPVLDVGKITLGEDETIGIVMTMEKGRTLAEDLDRRNTPVDPDEIAKHGIQICRALDEVYALGFVHRDLKPSNIFVDEFGDLKVSDFGITRAIGASEVGEDQKKQRRERLRTEDKVVTDRSTAPDGLVGTPGFMSPEQVKKYDAAPSDDIFSLGCIMYEERTGKGPFDVGQQFDITDINELLLHIQDDQIPSIQTGLEENGVYYEPDFIDSIIETMLSHNIENRLFAHVGDVVYPLLQVKDIPSQARDPLGEEYKPIQNILMLFDKESTEKVPKHILSAYKEGVSSATLVRMALDDFQKRKEAESM
jgi:serine/threonine protein kinase